MKKDPIIKVTSRSFSNHNILKQELLDLFPNAIFNPDGPSTGIENLVEYLKDADGMILGLEQMGKSTLQQLKQLQIIAKYGVGLDNLDVDAATELGISIGWSGGVNKRSASEQALGFMLSLSRNLFFSALHLKGSDWVKEGGFQLSKKCIGIIGCGYIGADLMHLLQPFNCDILIYDIEDKTVVADTYNARQVNMDELLEKADIISLHVPLTDITKSLVDESFLKRMKKSSFLINNSRGPVVSHSALKNALQNKEIAGAALDVYEIEPPDDIEFLALPNLMCTPHIGGNADEAVLAMGRSAIKHLKKYFL